MSTDSSIRSGRASREILRRSGPFGLALIASSALLFMAAGFGDVAGAATLTVQLGNAAPFAVLAGTTVTNTGSTNIGGSVGVYSGTAITGFPPGHIFGGVKHSADTVAFDAKASLKTAYDDAAGRTPFTTVGADIGTQTLDAGAYKNASALGITGTVTLDGQGDPNAVFIFQIGSTLITATSSTVHLINGAQPCNVFWQVGSSATIGVSSKFVGTVLALTSISVKTSANVQGRVLARNGQVSLESNTITAPVCANQVTTTSTSTTSTSSTTSTVPTGAPHTGFGGAARGGTNDVLLVLAGVAFVAGTVAVGGAVRRSRSSRNSQS